MFKDDMARAAALSQKRLASEFDKFRDVPVVRAMKYAVGGGKGLRAYLALESARLHGLAPERAIPAAAAVEAVHANSLVHDDLPAMDDDDQRRGKPTVHKKWDEATAILAGDALLTSAFQILSQDADTPAEIRLRLISDLGEAAGVGGMVLGQAQDMAAETAPVPLTLEEIKELQDNKTGALIRWAAQAGPILVGADIEPMARYSRALGLAFQIADDLLDVSGDQSKTGKAVGKDAKTGKATFVSLLGVDGARALAEELIDHACGALTPYGEAAQSLRDAARFVIERDA